jgi:hypothetical protein
VGPIASVFQLRIQAIFRNFASKTLAYLFFPTKHCK